MKPEFIAALVGSVFSLLLDLLPFVRQLWAKVDASYKPLVVLLFCMGTPFILAGLACANVDIGAGAVCPVTPQEWYDLAYLGIIAFISGQVTFKAVTRDNASKYIYADALATLKAKNPPPAG